MIRLIRDIKGMLGRFRLQVLIWVLRALLWCLDQWIEGPRAEQTKASVQPPIRRRNSPEPARTILP